MKTGIKRTGIFLLTLLLLSILLPSAALAEGNDPLVIDAKHKYAGMDSTYGNGYIPTVKDGSVTVVLPLVLNTRSGVRSIRNNVVTVKPDFVNTAQSPFVISNLEKTVVQANNPVAGGGVVKGWLVSLKIPLSPGRTNGVYPLALKVSYESGMGPSTQTITVFVTVSDSPGPAPKPRVIVSGCRIEPNPVMAGQEFDLIFSLMNTSRESAVRNVKVVVAGESTDLMPVAQGGAVVFDGLGKGESKELTVRMKARSDAQAKAQKVTASIDYEDAAGAVYTAAGDMIVEVSQPMRVEFDKPAISANVTAGETVPVSLNVFNMGRNKVQNVLCKVSAPGLLPEGSAFLGNMDPGASKTAEFFVYVGTRDMSFSNTGDLTYDNSVTELYGATSGFINVTWEDEFGKQCTGQVKLDTKIGQPPAPPPAAQPEQQSPEVGQWWISVAVAGVLIMAISVVTLLLKRKRAREARGNEAD